jgi:hypothetical protein
MQRQWPIFALVQLTLSGLWGVCIYRAFTFYFSTRAVVQLYGSGNSATDFRFSQHILFCYCTSFIIGTLLTYFMCKMNLWLLMFPILLIVLAALYVLVRKPEEVIVFFPSPAPYLALVASILAGAIGGAIIADRKQKTAL